MVMRLSEGFFPRVMSWRKSIVGRLIDKTIKID